MEISNKTTKNKVVKNIGIANRLFDNDYLESLKNVSNIIIKSDDVKHAHILVKVLSEAVMARKSELETVKEINDFYKKIVIKLKFIALPLLDDVDIVDLIKNYFNWQFRIPYYNILEKLEAKLLNIVILEDRDKFKQEVKKAVLDSKNTLTPKNENRTIADWLRNYNSKIGTGVADKLKRAEYLVNLTKNKKLDKHEIEKLKTLFNFYERLKLSSLTPQGFDERVPIIVKGKLYIFNQGTLEPVGKKISKIKAVEKLELPEGGISELQNMLNQYPKGSLERKAVEEEIAKLEAGGGGKKVGQ